MKKHLMIFVVVLMVTAIAAPAFATVEFQYGGQFRARFEVQDNVFDGTDQAGFYGSNYNSDDNRGIHRPAARLYFSFIASPNLKVVTKCEMGTLLGYEPEHGSSTGNTGANAGGNVGRRCC